MTRPGGFALVLVTAPDMKTARRLARAALDARLVACANLLPKIESHYWWQEKIDSSAEVLVIFKTSKTKLDALEKKHDAQFKIVFDAIRGLMAPPPEPKKGRIGFHVNPDE